MLCGSYGWARYYRILWHRGSTLRRNRQTWLPSPYFPDLHTFRVSPLYPCLLGAEVQEGPMGAGPGARFAFMYPYA